MASGTAKKTKVFAYISYLQEESASLLLFFFAPLFFFTPVCMMKTSETEFI